MDKYHVKVIGVQVDAIERGEDRIEFKHAMDKLGIEMARSEVAYSVEEALAIADKLDYPVVFVRLIQWVAPAAALFIIKKN